MKLINNYINTFKGLSKEIWWLALITLINRSGTMVVPFLSIYLTGKLEFSLADVGWIMAIFGLGSVVGSWIGGKLTDKIGYYKIMIFSLVFTGISFVLLQMATTFMSFAIGIFVLMIIADTFRPAMYVALDAYSTNENKTRSITLIRLAINLGFSVGPAIGGVIIATMSYKGLFWIDGITCTLAGIILFFVLNPKKTTEIVHEKPENPKSVFTDRAFLYFLVAMVFFGIAFLQYFSTIPLYYKVIHHLNEFQIGLLMAMNGFLIFVLEMPLVKWLESSTNKKLNLILLGGVLTIFSFIVINLSSWTGVLIIGMLLMTLGEMIAFPFSNSFAMQRANRGSKGQYMALYTVSFALGHIFGHKLGMSLIASYGYDTTWNIMSGFMLMSGLFLFLTIREIKKHKD